MKHRYSLLNTKNIVYGSCFDKEQEKQFKPLDGAERKHDNDWLKIANTGGNKAFSIMPPYYRVYCWRRTA